jgi:hypothetical protein
MKKIKFTLTVEQSLDGDTSVTVDCHGSANGMDAVAAIRALVNETARLTRNTPEKILGMVEKHTVAVNPALLVRS